MNHSKLTRVLTLAAASVAMLVLGAWLSYLAATQDVAAEQRQSRLVDPPSPEIILQAATPTAVAGHLGSRVNAQAQENVPEALVIRASLPVETRSLFSEADSSEAVLEMRGDSGPIPAVPAPLNGAEASVMPETDSTKLQQDAKPLDAKPLDAKPAGLAGDVLSGPLPQELVLPILSDRPVPVTGVPLPPPRPAALASLAAAAQPMEGAPAPQPQVVAAPPAPQATVTPKPAAGGALPNIANALAAVTASVGGADASLTPQPEAIPVFPEPTGGFKQGAQVYVRIFKREGSLELWMKKGDRFSLYKNYPICKWSGKLGPKLAFADYQSPEGFYSVSARQLNPHSAYHLSFDVGYPNAYDRRHGATGDKIMVHGDCKSVGCFAMTNAGIDEIYGFVAAALANGQKEVPVHIFPFRMTEEAILRETGGASTFLAFLDNGGPRQDWSPFWRNLKEGYDLFERSHQPPTAYACGDRYEFSAAAGACARIAGR